MKSNEPRAVSSGVFISTLSALKKGGLLVQADDALRELTAKVQKQQIKGKLTLTLEIAPNGTGVEINARLSFRINDSGKVTFHYILDRPFKVIEAAFNAIAANIETETGVPVMLGNGAVVLPR